MRYLLLLAAISLTACGTRPYLPTEYALRDGLIAPIAVNGQAQVSNGQAKTGPVTVYSYGGTQLSSDLKSITEVMVQQTRKELGKAARPAAGSPKTIEVRVDSLLTEYAFFHWNSNLKFEAKLGDGKIVAMTVPHTSGSVIQDLNGCIAESVMTLLNDPRVRTYLAQ